MQLQSIHEIISQKPYLAWYVKDVSELSEASVLEHVLNYGNWEDVQNFIKIYGLNQTAQLYRQLACKPRTNLRPDIKHYFKLYFEKHAS